MAPITTASNEETHAALLDTLDMQKVPKPFRNPNWKPPQRRNKNLKQILSEAQRAQRSIINTQQNSGASTPLPLTDGTATPADGGVGGLNSNPAQGSQDLSRLVLEKNAAKQPNGAASLGVPGLTQPSVTYTSIQAAPSLKPKKKYCDITGLPAKYTDPTTRLNYYNAEIYRYIRGLNTAQVQEYLAARNANTVLNAECHDGDDGRRSGKRKRTQDNVAGSSGSGRGGGGGGGGRSARGNGQQSGGQGAAGSGQGDDGDGGDGGDKRKKRDDGRHDSKQDEKAQPRPAVDEDETEDERQPEAQQTPPRKRRYRKRKTELDDEHENEDGRQPAAQQPPRQQRRYRKRKTELENLGRVPVTHSVFGNPTLAGKTRGQQQKIKEGISGPVPGPSSTQEIDTERARLEAQDARMRQQETNRGRRARERDETVRGPAMFPGLLHPRPLSGRTKVTVVHEK